jgi:hypothetical protein
MPESYNSNKKSLAVYYFIQNYNNQQEKFLLAYSFFVAGICVYVIRDLQVLGLTLIVLVSILIVSYVANQILEVVQLAKTKLIVLGGCFYLCMLFYFERYFLLYFVFVIALLFFAKQVYVKRNKESKGDFLIQFWAGSDIIKKHLETEFRLFYKLQIFNVYVLFVSGLCFYLDVMTLVSIPFISREVLLDLRLLLLIIFLLNFFLLLCIRWIIIDYCNTRVPLAAAQKVAMTVGGVVIALPGAALTTAALITAHPEVPTPFKNEIQEALYDFRFEKSYEMDLYKKYQAEIGGPVPIKSDARLISYAVTK